MTSKRFAVVMIVAATLMLSISVEAQNPNPCAVPRHTFKNTSTGAILGTIVGGLAGGKKGMAIGALVGGGASYGMDRVVCRNGQPVAYQARTRQARQNGDNPNVQPDSPMQSRIPPAEAETIPQDVEAARPLVCPEINGGNTEEIISRLGRGLERNRYSFVMPNECNRDVVDYRMIVNVRQTYWRDVNNQQSIGFFGINRSNMTGHGSYSVTITTLHREKREGGDGKPVSVWVNAPGRSAGVDVQVERYENNSSSYYTGIVNGNHYDSGGLTDPNSAAAKIAVEYMLNVR